MEQCALNYKDESLKEYVEATFGISSTPFSRAGKSFRRYEGCYKIGLGECNNYPLIKHI